ncbi:hypothetical protein [Flavobacterium sp. AED]|uniref:hypothetical protein n=1 Tax=Flavobacterium sp. AED TaxID=1423323 RepID=UPI00057EF480|nr:hypothetical protein [Flavobacterium sp. AED]KIA86851.1 hypothetical protein OA85_04250 [Flavobacterium sp. AED]MDI1307115.1 hypothetical protein [bacterium]
MKKLLIYGALIFTFFSCSNNSESIIKQKSIIGKWEWTKSSGGISGETLTPSSTGKSIVIEISNLEVKILENGNLSSNNPYAIETKESIFGGQRQMMVYALGKPSQSFSVVGDKLFLNDECYDCYQSEYVKQ